MYRNCLRLCACARWLLTRGCVLAIAWLAFCARVNFQFAQAAHGRTLPRELAFTFAGFVGGQFAWVAIWSVLAPWTLLHRAVFCAAATLGILVSVTEPYWMYSFVAQMRDFALSAALVPMALLAVQSPLWAARTWFGWRIVQPMIDRPSIASRAVGIRDLLLATACFGVALSIFRVPQSRMPYEFPVRTMVFFAFIYGFLAFANLLLALPAVASILRPHQGGASVILVIFVQTVILGLAVGATCFFSRSPQTRVIGEITNIVVSAFVTLDLSLFLARGAGYRLQWRRRTARAT